LSEEQLLVHLLEVEGEIERPAQAGVAEFGAADIERKRLHDPGAADRELFEHHALLGDSGKIVSGRPILGAVLDTPIYLVTLEGFDRHRGVAQVDVAY